MKHLTSIVERYPVCGMLPGSRENLHDRPIILPIPRIIPTGAHIAVERVRDSQFLQAIQEVSERHVPGTVDHAQFPADLTQSPIPIYALGLNASLETLTIMEQKTLAKTHSSILGNRFQWRFGIHVRVIVKVPPAFFAPGENSIVRTAFVS